MYKTILIHVDESPRSLQRVDIAARLAEQYQAHLIGAAMTGLSPYIFPVGAFDPTVPPIVFPVDELRAQASSALDGFEAAVQRAGVSAYERRLIDDEAGIGMSLLARYSDLVIISQIVPTEFQPRLRSDFPEYVVLNSARPVLVLPASGAHSDIGRRITVAWNGSAEAVRAITSAIAIMQRAGQVDLVVFDADLDGDVHGEEPGADIALFLARHGIKVEVTSAQSAGDEGEALLTFATDKGADLIVMGAYGHSRFREFLLGGMSRTVLASSPIALWMSH